MSPDESHPTRGRILIVETPSVFREMQSLLLQRTGYEVVACDKPGSIDDFRTQDFDVVLLNFGSPRANCTDAAAAVRQLWPGSAIIVLAELLTVEGAQALAQSGVAAALPRTVDPQVLTERIEALVTRQQSSHRAH